MFLRSVFTALGVTLLSAVPAAAQITFSKIADSSTAVPDGSGTFESLGFVAPSISDSTVAFRGTDSVTGYGGIYTGTAGGSLTVVADWTTAAVVSNFAPGGFSAPSISNGTVAFVGRDAFPSISGIYTRPSGGSLSLAGDNLTTLQSEFFEPSISGSTIAFMARDYNALLGIYTLTENGSFSVVADANTAVPSGSGNFSGTGGFSFASISGGTVAFRGRDSVTGNDGIYTWTTGGSLSLVAGTNTTVPGGSGNFSGFSPPSISGGLVAFRGRDSVTFNEGIYTGTAGGSPSLVADTNTTVPGGSGNFSAFDAPSISGGTVAFGAQDSVTSNYGIYFHESGGSLAKLVAVGDTLSGKTVNSLVLGTAGLSGSTIAFTVGFSDGSGGIYTGTFVPVPEPSTICLMAITGLGVIGWVRRRRR